MPERIALATCAVLPEPDYDEAILVEGLNAAGWKAEPAAWDDPDVDWGSYRACIVRSTWNYHFDPVRFAEWATRTSRQCEMFNSLGTILDNIDKSYLKKLESYGVPIVPTQWASTLEELERLALPERFVMKPTVSAGSYRTALFERSAALEASEHARIILEDGPLMIQPFIESVPRGGETSWVWIDGKITHGVRKWPRFAQDVEEVSAAFEPTDDELKRIEPFVRHVPEGCLYARIDVMEDEGCWLLSELELIEPSLFFLQFPAALEPFIGAVAKRLNL